MLICNYLLSGQLENKNSLVHYLLAQDNSKLGMSFPVLFIAFHEMEFCCIFKAVFLVNEICSQQVYFKGIVACCSCYE